MKTEKMTLVFGWRVYGVGVAALGLTCLAFGDFNPGQTVPKNFPVRTALAYSAGAFMVVAAAAIEWRRTAVWGAAALTGYYAVFVLLLMNGRLLLSGYAVYGTYENIAMQLAIAASALIVYATIAQIDRALIVRLTRLGRMADGVWRLSHDMGRSPFYLYEPDRPAGPKMAAAGASFLGICNRSLLHRGRPCDPDRNTGQTRRDSADGYDCILRLAGEWADARGRSLEPLELDRKRTESGSDRGRLGCGGLAG
jgi:hypothetical protein